MPEFLQNLPVVMIPFAILAWLYNQNNLRWMQERKELAEAILVERKQVISERDGLMNRLFAMEDRRAEREERMIAEMTKDRAENHAMRGKLTEFILRLENYFGGRTDTGTGTGRRSPGGQNE